jgi:hypothetical protein
VFATENSNVNGKKNGAFILESGVANWDLRLILIFLESDDN